MKRNDWIWVAIGSIVVLFAGAVGLATWLFFDAGGDTRPSMRLDLFKYVLQLIVVVLIGSSVAAMYKAIERSREAAQQRAELRKQYVARLGETYRTVKQARRELRAAGLWNVAGVVPGELSPEQKGAYDEQMCVISKGQLALEALKIEARYFPVVKNGSKLEKTLEGMEKYLSGIVSEYEEKRPQTAININALKNLNDFTSKVNGDTPRRAGSFVVEFSGAHAAAVRILARK